MKIQMELLSDTIFGNGMSIPGAEDISVQCDAQGFPYYKGTTLKGVFREELERYLSWKGMDEGQIQEKLKKMLGYSGNDNIQTGFVFSDLCISEYVKQAVLEEVWKRHGGDDKHDVRELVLSLFTHVRSFTRITENGVAKKGSLRMARCVDRGNWFYGEILCDADDEEFVLRILDMVRWIGTMRNRGFGNVRITRMEVGR